MNGVVNDWIMLRTGRDMMGWTAFFFVLKKYENIFWSLKDQVLSARECVYDQYIDEYEYIRVQAQPCL